MTPPESVAPSADGGGGGGADEEEEVEAVSSKRSSSSSSSSSSLSNRRKPAMTTRRHSKANSSNAAQGAGRFHLLRPFCVGDLKTKVPPQYHFFMTKRNFQDMSTANSAQPHETPFTGWSIRYGFSAKTVRADSQECHISAQKNNFGHNSI